MSITKTVKDYIITKFDMDFVGIADANALLHEPKGHRPIDLLPGAKNVIVFGRKIQDGVIQAAFRVHENKMRASHSTWQAFGNELAPNILLANACFDISNYLETVFSTVAMPLPFGSDMNAVWDIAPGPMFADPYGQGFPLDLAKAAFAAGLGEIGWSNRFLTPQYGPRQILCAIITTMDLEPDSPYKGKKLCDPKSCGICSKICPTCAIPKDYSDSKIIKVGDVENVVSNIKANACIVADTAFRQEFTIFATTPELIEGNNPSDDELKDAFHKKPMHTTSVDHYPKCYCEKCLLYCPVGNWKEHFADTSLSNADF